MTIDLPDFEELLTEPTQAILDSDAAGETLVVYTPTYAGEDEWGDIEWTPDESGTISSGLVLERNSPQEIERAVGEDVSARYNIFVPSDAPVQDGRRSEEDRQSIIEDESGLRYEVALVQNEGNGALRCYATLLV